MITTATFLSLLPSPGDFRRAARIKLLRDLCQSIRDDLCERGPDPQLMLLGAALDYCTSLLAEAGEDPIGDELDAALAQLDHELAQLAASLRAALFRKGDLAPREAAAELLRSLFPATGMPDPPTAARAIVQQAQTADVKRAIERLGLGRHLQQLEQALAEGDRCLTRIGDITAADSEVRLRARSATRMADALLRRIVGHVIAVTDSADTSQRVRAAALLGPLLEARTPFADRKTALVATGRRH